MKRIIILLIVLATYSLQLFSQSNSDVFRGYVKYIGSSAPGSITVQSSGFTKKKLAESEKDALSQAFYTLLFRGIPGSQYELPIIADETSMKNNAVVTTLLEDGFMSFVTDSKVVEQEKKVRKTDGAKGLSVTYELTINCDALRRYLEQNNVIRKFGI